MNRITLLISASEEYWKLAEYSAPNKLEYCLRHGIAFTMRKHVRIGDPWGERPKFMLEELERMNDGDWLWFMGVDTLITNMTIDVRKFLGDDAPDLTIAKDVNGMNNDVFFLRKTESSIRFLREVLALNTKLPDDQEAMKQVIEQGWLTVKFTPQEPFNSYLFDEYRFYRRHYPIAVKEGQWEKGRFVLHMPGIPNARRYQLMEKHLPDVVR